MWWETQNSLCLSKHTQLLYTKHGPVRSYWKTEVAQACLTLCNPMDHSIPVSSVHGIFQARVLEWVAISFSRGSYWPRDRTRVSHIAGRRFTIWATREATRSQGHINKYSYCLKTAIIPGSVIVSDLLFSEEDGRLIRMELIQGHRDSSSFVGPWAFSEYGFLHTWTTSV